MPTKFDEVIFNACHVTVCNSNRKNFP